jgi:GAF domain-containing protein
MLGVLEVYHRQWPGFEERDVGLLNEIGERIGAALQNAELFQRLQAWAPQSQGPIADGSEESSKPV